MQRNPHWIFLVSNRVLLNGKLCLDTFPTVLNNISACLTSLCTLYSVWQTLYFRNASLNSRSLLVLRKTNSRSVVSSRYFSNKVHLSLWLKFDINYDPCLELSGHLCYVVFMGCIHTYSLSSDASVLCVCTLFKSPVQ
jgi:hypothetical protein